MKKLTLLATLFMATISFGQTAEETYKAKLDSIQKSAEKLTTAKVYEDVKAGFSKLVSNLQGPAKHVYSVYVQQHFTVGLIKMITSAFFLLLFFIIALRMWKPADFGSEDANTFNRHALFFVLSCLGAIITLICTAFYMGGDMAKLINPEYYAIQDIIKAFK